MADDFSRIKDILNPRLAEIIAAEAGRTVKNVGAQRMLDECPFCGGHDCFNVQGGGWKCFQCDDDKKGDLFTFLEEYGKTDRKGALERGAKLAGITLEQRGRARKPPAVADQLRLDAAAYYHGAMLENGGKAYLTDTRCHTLKTLELEQVGFSDGRLLDHLRSKGFPDMEILESGLVKESEIEGRKVLRDFFGKGFVVFPHMSQGKVLHFTMKDPNKKYAYQLPNEKRDKKWLFYGQDVLDRHDEVILVEGENDRLQLLNAGIPYVIAMIGQISDDQVKGLFTRCKGKHLYLWTDNDGAGRTYIRKICRALKDATVKVIVYGKAEDDPDSYLKGFEGDRKREIRRLQADAVDYATWEINQALEFTSLEIRLAHLKAPGGDAKGNVFRIIGQKVLIEQQTYIEKLEKLGFSRKALEQQLDFSQDLIKQISEYKEMLTNPRDLDPILLGEIIFKFFAHHGRFYYDREDTVYLIYQNHTYVVDNNTAFNALMLKMARMIPEAAPGTQVWSAIKHTAYLNGRRIDMGRWILTDTDKDTIFYNLNGPDNVILKLSPERIEEIQNGMNDDHVLLASSRKVMPFTFLPDTDIQEGMTLLKELIFNNLAVKHEQKYLILSWLISGLCPDWSPYQFLMKFEGYASSGKSTAAKLLTALLYKTEDLSDNSAAAAFSSATKNPMVVIDNLEHKDLNRSLVKFLLLVATRGQKEKRKGGSDTDTVEESPRALICITAIEPFTLSELISRTFVIPFDRRQHGMDNFHESEVVEQIKKKRNLILSALLRFIQKEVLPDLKQRELFMTILNKQFKGHSKDRTNAYLALLMLILEKMLKYMPYYRKDDLMYGIESGDKDIYTAWIQEQNASCREVETGSNAILTFLDGLIREYLKHFRGQAPQYEGDLVLLDYPEYGLKITKSETVAMVDEKSGEHYHRTVFEFTATSAEVVDAFEQLAKNRGKHNPYDSASVFMARLRNDSDLLKKNGWELVPTPGVEPYYRKVKGQRFLKFRHTMNR